MHLDLDLVQDGHFDGVAGGDVGVPVVQIPCALDHLHRGVQAPVAGAVNEHLEHPRTDVVGREGARGEVGVLAVLVPQALGHLQDGPQAAGLRHLQLRHNALAERLKKGTVRLYLKKTKAKEKENPTLIFEAFESSSGF
jgi:hypothetical protein